MKKRWPPEVEQALLDEHEKAYGEGVGVGYDMGADAQKEHDTALLYSLLRNKHGYTAEQVYQFIEEMNQEPVSTREDDRRVLDEMRRELQETP